MATAFLGLVFANQTTDAAYSGRLFNYAAYQVSLCNLDHNILDDRCQSTPLLQYCAWPARNQHCGCHLSQHTTSTYDTPRPARSMVGGGAAAATYIVPAAWRTLLAE